MSITSVQSALTLAIEVIALGALFGFSAAFTAELVAGFFKFRAAQVQPPQGGEIAPEVLAEASAAIGELMADLSEGNPAGSLRSNRPAPAAEVVSNDEPVQPQPAAKGQVVQLFPAAEATDRQSDMMLMRSLETMTVGALRKWASNEKIEGRSAWRTKPQLIAGIVAHEALMRDEARRSA